MNITRVQNQWLLLFFSIKLECVNEIGNILLFLNSIAVYNLIQIIRTESLTNSKRFNDRKFAAFRYICQKYTFM